MKKYFYVLAALSLLAMNANAQGPESDVDAELDALYASTQKEDAPAKAKSTKVETEPIVIVNKANSVSGASKVPVAQPSEAQKQPTTLIEATPIAESRAEKIRRNRQDVELLTEQKIVEKLEQSRMEDEKKRADVLFGDRNEPIGKPQPEKTREIVREEVAAAIKDDEMLSSTVDSKYVAGILGIGDYPDTKQVSGNYAMGVAFGSKFENFILEGTFLYSNYTVGGQGYYSGLVSTSYSYGYLNPYANNGVYVPDSIDVQQYAGSLAAKVQLFDGMIKPVFGGLVSYSYRNYSWNNNTFYGYVNDNKANSSAVDVGAIIGADLDLSSRYSLGLDYRYMWNLSSKVNGGNTWMAGPQYGTQLEKLQYYVMSLVGRVNF